MTTIPITHSRLQAAAGRVLQHHVGLFVRQNSLINFYFKFRPQYSNFGGGYMLAVLCAADFIVAVLFCFLFSVFF